MFMRTWDLGFTAFGGPPVHFQILHRRFVEGIGFGGGGKWIDEQTVSKRDAVMQYQHESWAEDERSFQ
jgi:chromate transport protein ChrA